MRKPFDRRAFAFFVGKLQFIGEFEFFKRYSFSSPFCTLPHRIIVGADSISAREKSLQINEIGVISFAGGYGIRPYR